MTQNRQYVTFIQASLLCLVIFMPLQGFAIGSIDSEIETDATPSFEVSQPITFIPSTRTAILLAQAVDQQTPEPKAGETTDPGSNPQPIVIENGKYGPVKPGDNLYQIARTALPKDSKISLQDAMQVIFDANPHAFLEAMEQIKLGAYLTIPNFPDEVSISETTEDQPTSPVLDSIALPADDQEGVAPFVEKPTIPDTPLEETTSEETTSEETTSEETASEETASEETLPKQELAAKPTEEESEPPKETDETITKSNSPSEITAPFGHDLPNDQQSAPKSVDEPINQLNEDSQVSDDTRASDDPPIGNDAPVVIEPSQPQATQDGINNELVDVRSQLAQAREELDRLINERESIGERGTTINRMSTSLAQNPMLQWVPWILVALMLPALLFLLLRHRKPTETFQTQEYPDIQPPAVVPDSTVNEFESPTLTGQSPLEKAGDTVEIMTSPVFGVPGDQSESSHDSSELEPSGPDTPQPLRPGLLAGNSAQTLEGEERRIQEADASLDTSQEAEIYLAYEQYSLAERTINQLLESEPDNDRNLLLQLKLFSQTGRMNELKNLSVELLQKHPDMESDTHKEIQNICAAALNQHSSMGTTQLPSGEITTETATQKLDETTNNDGAIEKEEIEEIKEIDPLTESPASDELYSDDIADYLSEDSLSDLDGLSADTMNIEYEDFAHALLDDNAPLEDLTEQEMDAISAEMELMDDPDQVIMEPSNSVSNYPEVEGLSDEDPHYAIVEDATVELDPQDRDSDSIATNLDIPFDQSTPLKDSPTEDEITEKTDLSERKPQ